MEEPFKFTVDYRDPNLYENAKFSRSVRNTFSNRIPAQGKGQFPPSAAQEIGIKFCLTGRMGCQRYYVGDRLCCCLCASTCGCCGCGQLIDICCLIEKRQKEINNEIRREAHKAYDQRRQNIPLMAQQNKFAQYPAAQQSYPSAPYNNQQHYGYPGGEKI
ncbi:MAG: hypothetical protein EZS28_013682 [Streblomastix strix]|uniref:Uncharacterized protein n=1 Tax=Streblomastix strix TaxID=222440 RepID=A0A5J4W8X4_9EUKA|nr:MAG: hypothetical protein EZS28_013682 [Streblomastix strix]